MPDFLGAIAPIVTSAAVGRGDPRVMAAGLAGYMRGREMKRAQTESAADRDLRKRTEQAEFYSNLLKSAQTYDDEAALRRDLEAVRPIADLHGVNVDLIHVSDTRKAERTRKDAAATFEQLRKVHGASVDDPAWQSAHSTTVNGTTMKVSDLATLANMPRVTDQAGQAIAPGPKVDTPNTPEEQFYATFAREHGARAYGELTTTLQGQAREAWQKSGRAAPAPPNVGSFEDFVVRKFGANPTPAQIATARAQYESAGRKPDESGASNSELVQAVLDNPELYDRLTAAQVAKIAPSLNAAGFKGFGKSLNESAIQKISESKSAIASLKDLRDVLKENEHYIGPIAGFQAINPYSDARKAQSKIDLVKQRVGKALEGGVLRKEDEEKYKKILATLNDEPSTAIYKVDSIIQTLERDLETFVDEQRSAGRRVPPSAAPKAPAGWKYVPKPGGGWTAVVDK